MSKYDVFISYSRRDYVDSEGNVLPDSPVKHILEFLKEKEISYWFDKEGIYSSQEFAHIIVQAIHESRMMLFVSSMHSNQSDYTAGEIKEALDTCTPIVIVKVDGTAYGDKFRCLINTIDFIDYSQADAKQRLLDSINKTKDEIENKTQAELLKYEEIKSQIRGFANRIEELCTEKEGYLKEIYTRLRKLSVHSKQCPVCGVSHKINAEYCISCGWYFNPLSSIKIDGEKLGRPENNTRLTLSRNRWQKNPIVPKLTLKQIIADHKVKFTISALCSIILFFGCAYILNYSEREKVKQLSVNLQTQIELSRQMNDTLNVLIRENFAQKEIIREKERFIETFIKEINLVIPFGKSNAKILLDSTDLELKIQEVINEVNSYNGTLVSIEIIQTTSPEGKKEINDKFNMARSLAITKVIEPYFSNVKISAKSKIHTWFDVADILRQEGHIKEADAIYAMKDKSHEEIGKEIRKNRELYYLTMKACTQLRYTTCKFKMVHSSYAQ